MLEPARANRVSRLLGAALLTAALAGASAGGASAQNSPLAPLPAPAPAPVPAPARTETAPPSTNGRPDDGLGSGAQIALFGVGGALLLGIGWVIVRDARRAAPDAGGQRGAAGGAQRRYDRDRARSRAKAARKQRRRNR